MQVCEPPFFFVYFPASFIPRVVHLILFHYDMEISYYINRAGLIHYYNQRVNIILYYYRHPMKDTAINVMNEVVRAMKENQEHKGIRDTFSGSFGYVMATAASAVGLGNIWRFPYLAAKYGGGIFLIVYLVLVVTFGHAMLMSETALGRMTRKSPVGAFQSFGNSFPLRFGGWLNAIVPMLIAPYYSFIGGWIIKYLYEYLVGNTTALADDHYFTGFITTFPSAEICFVVFTALTFIIVLMGVGNGVEKASKIMMPLLVLLAIIISVYSITRPGAMEGVRYFFIPNFKKFSLMTLVAAMGQMFFSLSIAMGILYTYGSYLKKDGDIEKTSRLVEGFDTGVSILAGLMIIPAIFVFLGGSEDNIRSGPSLMFITIPKIFESMGLGQIPGILFFLMVLFAALTSSISLMESGVSTFMDQLGWSRARGCILMGVIMLLLGTACALGYSVWSAVQPLGMSILDLLDFLTNSIMMPLAALCTCFLIARRAGIKAVVEEIRISSSFKGEKIYAVTIKYLAPIILTVILVSSIAATFGWLKI